MPGNYETLFSRTTVTERIAALENERALAASLSAQYPTNARIRKQSAEIETKMCYWIEEMRTTLDKLDGTPGPTEAGLFEME